MKYISLVILIGTLLLKDTCFAQIPVGHYFDINGEPIEGYLDLLEYNPEQQLIISYNSDSFEKGHFFDMQGVKKEGLIKLENKKVWFKAFDDDKKIRLKPEEVKGLVVGIDSFFTARNFHIEKKMGPIFRTNPEFIQFITSFGNFIYAKHFNFNSQAISETYLVREKSGSAWTSFPVRKSAFKKKALKYFGHIPYLKNKINNKELSYDDMMTLIKVADYHYKYVHNQSIFFDKFWQETRDENFSVFHAKIVNKEDSIWTMEYYKGNNKIYSVQYSSFYHNRKNGLFTSYFESGKIRKTTRYVNDKPSSINNYFKNGGKHYQYQLKEYETRYITQKSRHYRQVNNTSGINLIDGEQNFQEEFEDGMTGRTITNEFQSGKLVNSYSVVDGQKIYRICDPNYTFKINPLQRKLVAFMKEKDFKDAFKENTQGVVLVVFTINQKGYTTHYQLLNQLHPEVDQLISRFLGIHFNKNNRYKHKFKSYKVGKKKVSYEVVIPIRFMINKFYRKPSYFYHNNMFWHHNQMMMDNINNNIKVPSLPQL